uniref:Uncharacterized protein LOC117357324 n=1 Tax=Geotrypetes seraphini TaxID=260995 RepID=A0A6P8QB55_GEOSA|nr:uncharacterized protein LOC117357324 [Geotrypetes seraphini]
MAGRTRSTKATIKVSTPASGGTQGMAEVCTKKEEGDTDRRVEVSVQTETIPLPRYTTVSMQTEEPVRGNLDEDILQELLSLREEVKRLRSIRDDEAFIDDAILELSHITERTHDRSILDTPIPIALNTTIRVQEMIRDAGPWQLVTSSTGKRRKHTSFSPSSSSSFSLQQGSSTSIPQLTLGNKFQILQEGTTEETADGTQEDAQLPASNSGPPRKERRVVVIGDSMLRGTEGPICRPNLQSREAQTTLLRVPQRTFPETLEHWERS